ncbi:MAG: nodulation protein NfeD [Deltaproteobacteria bacterium]|nr:nodulation protein NfeD [Deltaproteobacteria bacterium]MBI3386681.1 nodulation protein NfeD [Deltaproteobacteria bacterium]
MKIHTRVLARVALLLVLLSATAGAAEHHVNLIEIDAGINPATADFIREAIDEAHRDGAQALIIQLDTPGGLLDSSKAIVKDLLGSPVPVIVYVAPSGAGATSAGVFVTMAANLAAMAPGTNIGAAHPVGGQGEDIAGDMREKAENFTASLSKSIAQQRGRNVEWAEKAVRESVSITAQEALKLGVIDLVAIDIPDLLRQADGREVDANNTKLKLALADATVARKQMRLKQTLLNIIANPNVAYLLMMAGLLGLYVEFTHPGVFFPGIAGAICLVLGLTALQVLPINYSGLALILLGVAMLVAELFLPSFGVVGVGGLIAFVIGSLLLFDTADSDLAVDRGIIAAAAATLGSFTLWVGYLVVHSQRRKPSLGQEGMIGEVGEVRQRLAPAGKVFVHGEYWNAVAEAADDPLDVGAQVQVVAIEGLKIVVRALRPALSGREGGKR